MTRPLKRPRLKPGPKPGTVYKYKPGVKPGPKPKPRKKYMRVDLVTGEVLETRFVVDPGVLTNSSECYEWLTEFQYKREFEPEPVEEVEELLRISALHPPIPVETRSPIGSGLDPKLLERQM